MNERVQSKQSYVNDKYLDDSYTESDYDEGHRSPWQDPKSSMIFEASNKHDYDEGHRSYAKDPKLSVVYDVSNKPQDITSPRKMHGYLNINSLTQPSSSVMQNSTNFILGIFTPFQFNNSRNINQNVVLKQDSDPKN